MTLHVPATERWQCYVPHGMAEARRICPTCGAAYAGEALFCPSDGAPLAARSPGSSKDPYLGLEIGGRILLDRLVGIGSMGRVYRAWQAGIERAVAVKILHRELMNKETIVARFEREARVAGGLHHPNVIALHDAGILSSGEPYLVMEFLDGHSLRSALAASAGPLSSSRTLHLGLQICDAMGDAHDHGVVHRDLKPDNVMLVRRGADPDFVKVLDFGVARIGEADSSLATHAGALLGTATYACPESARGERVNQPGDVYSIATMLFECFAGAPPFSGKSPVDLLIQHARTEAPDVRSRPGARNVPEPIARVLAKNLGKAPEGRAQNARELGQELATAARESGFDEAASAFATLGRPAPALASAGKPFVRLATLLVGASLLAFASPVRAQAADAAASTPEAPPKKGIRIAPEPVGAPRGDAAPPGPPSPDEPDPPPSGHGAGELPPPLTEESPAPGTRPLPLTDTPPFSGTTPIGMRHAEEEDERVTKGQIELGAGFFTLPGAQVCIASFVGCSKGDTSLTLSAWPMFRRGRFAIGAGVMVGITSSANAPRNDPVDLPRDHYRRYFSVEITGRYYVPLSKRMDGWGGLYAGLGVVNDTFQSQKGLTDKAVIGVRGVTLLTEGLTLGVGLGLSYQLSENFLFGGGLRVSNWFLPNTPARDPLGDRASLTGNVAVVDLGLTLAYRSRLVF